MQPSQTLLCEIAAYVSANYGPLTGEVTLKPVDQFAYRIYQGFAWVDDEPHKANVSPPEWDYSHTVEIGYTVPPDKATEWTKAGSRFAVLIGITSPDRVRLDNKAKFSVWMD